jgi:hypothetical protein
MLTADRAVRRLGGPGFETQTLVWLAGRLDAGRLRAALGRLARRWPAVVSRLVESAADGGPCWRFRLGAVCEAREADVPGDAPQAVLDHAARLLSASADPADADPVRFHLLHRPGGRDVLLMQYNHTLLDHAAALRVLREIDRPAEGPAAAADPPAGWRRDPIWAHLRRVPRPRRRRAALAAFELWRSSARRGAVRLGGASAPAGPAPLGVAARRLPPDATGALQDRVVRACGFPNLSMALLGSAFRTVARLAPPSPRTDAFMAGIGLDLGPRGDGPLLQNWTSLIPIAARRDELDDRDAAWRLLSRRLRERLADEADLGTLALAVAFGRRPRQALWATELFLRYAFSLWYAYFGGPDALGESFCGAAVEDLFSVGPCWPAVGVTLLVNRFRGALSFQATSAAGAAAAGEFLDRLLGDLAP